MILIYINIENKSKPKEGTGEQDLYRTTQRRFYYCAFPVLMSFYFLLPSSHTYKETLIPI